VSQPKCLNEADFYLQSVQLGYTVPFTSVFAGKYGQQKNQKQTLLKLSTTQVKQTTQNTAKQNYPGSVTRPGNEVGLFYILPSPHGTERRVRRHGQVL